MHKFGDQNEFAIWVDYFKDLLKGDPILDECPDTWGIGGRVYFWVKNINIFEFESKEPEITYGGDLSEIVSYLSNNLFFHLIDDPFPVKTVSTVGIKMSKEATLNINSDDTLDYLHDIDWSAVDMDEQRKLSIWRWRHSWFADTSMLEIPEAIFRKIDNQIEISWEASKPISLDNGKVTCFQNMSGVERVDIKLYRDVISKFCLNFLDTFKERKYERMIENRAELQKALAIEL